jgi:hypothetical protein
VQTSALLQGLHFVGRAEGEKLSYDVFESNQAYLVFSPNKRGGLNVAVVSKDAPELISLRFRRKHVSRNDVVEKIRKRKMFSDSFAPLNALYVMVALGRARKLKQRQGRAMVFKIK